MKVKRTCLECDSIIQIDKKNIKRKIENRNFEKETHRTEHAPDGIGLADIMSWEIVSKKCVVMSFKCPVCLELNEWYFEKK